MMLPMMGFFFMLVVFGGIGSFAVLIDNHAAHRAPVPFAIFFAGVTAIAVFVIGSLISAYINGAVGNIIAMLFAPTVGLLLGFVLGYRLGLVRRRHTAHNS